MSNNSKTNQKANIEDLLLSIKSINDNNHSKVEEVLSRMKNDNPSDKELHQLINDLHDEMEDYVMEVTDFVSNVKQYSLSYFRKIRDNIT